MFPAIHSDSQDGNTVLLTAVQRACQKSHSKNQHEVLQEAGLADQCVDFARLLLDAGADKEAKNNVRAWPMYLSVKFFVSTCCCCLRLVLLLLWAL
jgi:hypothetical protein